MVSIPHPGNCAQGDDDDNDVGNRPGDENRHVVDRMVPEVVHDLQNEPASTRQRTTAVDASEMLRYYC